LAPSKAKGLILRHVTKNTYVKPPWVNAMITSFSDLDTFSAKRTVFLKTKVIITIICATIVVFYIRQNRRYCLQSVRMIESAHLQLDLELLLKSYIVF
jgi:hypothetical protein